MRFPMRARGAPSAMVAVVAALAFATGGIAYGASVVGDGPSTADVQPDQGTPGTAPGGTADVEPGRGSPPSKSTSQGTTAGMADAPEAPAVGDKPTDVDTSDLGVKNLPVTEDEGTKNLPEVQERAAR